MIHSLRPVVSTYSFMLMRICRIKYSVVTCHNRSCFGRIRCAEEARLQVSEVLGIMKCFFPSREGRYTLLALTTMHSTLKHAA